jgi:hypothetical protein
MNHQTDRRHADRRTDDDELSPEYLALLEVCGGEMRASDRTLLAQRRRSIEGADAVGALPAPASTEPVRPAADRRAAKS